MTTTRSKKQRRKASAFVIGIAIAIWAIAGCAAGAQVATVTHTASAPAVTSSPGSSHSLTAADLARNHHGHNIIKENVGPTPNADGLMSQAHFMRHGMLYQADIFVSATAKAKFFKNLKAYGFAPKWEGAKWGIWPVKSS